jgi:CRP/FNR family transcriptional regulator
MQRAGCWDGLCLEEREPGFGSPELHFPQSIQIARDCPAGTVLFHEGECAQGIFLLCKGAMKLSMGSVHDDRTIMRVARPGEILGLSSAMCGGPHEVTAQALVDSELLFVSRKDFLQYVREHASACFQVVLQMSKNLEAAYDWIRAVASSRVRHCHAPGFSLRDDHHTTR